MVRTYRLTQRLMRNIRNTRRTTHVLTATMLTAAVAMATLGSCSHAAYPYKDCSAYAAELLDSTLRHYRSATSPLLYNENHPYSPDEKVTYLAGTDTVSRDKVAYLWPTSGIFSATNALLEATGDKQYRRLLDTVVLPGLHCYYDTLRTPHCYQSYIAEAGLSDRFYDDNVWLGIDFTDTYMLTGNKAYLDSARTVWSFIESGQDDVLGGGIYWCEQKKHSKNTCSNAPGAVMALKLYRATKDPQYLEAGERLYKWTKANLQDPADYLYYDNRRLDGTLGKTKYQYNSGQMLQAAALLYKITGQEDYLADAHNLAQACSDHFFTTEQGKSYRVLKDGNVWFVAVMMRGYVELFGIDGNPKYLDDFAANLRHMWKHSRSASGLFGDNRFKGGTADTSRKWLLTQAAVAEMYARLSDIKTNKPYAKNNR